MKVKAHCGPAFPFNYHNQTHHHQESFTTNGMVAPDAAEQYMGLSMRDYFAVRAMQALIAKSPFLAEPQSFEVHNKTAVGAYEYADAMLRAGGHIE